PAAGRGRRARPEGLRGGRRRRRAGGRTRGETVATAEPEDPTPAAPALSARGDAGVDRIAALDPALTPERDGVSARSEEHHDCDRQEETHPAILDRPAAARQYGVAAVLPGSTVALRPERNDA